MTFLNTAMLFGLLAIAVPILIHLLNRSKAKVLDWGAMRFLLASLTAQNRRILIEEIILLAMRCLLVALVVLAIARPFLPSRSQVPWAIVLPAVLGAAVCVGVMGAMWSHRRARWGLMAAAIALTALACTAPAVERWWQELRWARGRGERDVAILLDASMSMTLRVKGRSSFERAVEEARAVVNACLPGDAVSLILAGPVPRPVIATPTPDRQEIRAALEGLQPMGGTMGVLEALNAAGASLAEGNNAAKNIVLITDGQNVGWDVRSEARWRFLAEGLEDLPSQPRIVCRRLPLPKRLRNAAVADVTFSRKVVGTDRPVRVSVQVMNTGTSPIKPAEIELTVDGAKVGSERLVTNIEPRATETVSFEHRFSSPGPRLVAARIAGRDDLPADDTASRVLNVIDRLSVLIVDGTPATRPLGGAADFIDIALTPKGENEQLAGNPGHDADDGVRYLVEPTVVPAPDIASVTDLDRYAAVILANVPRLPAAVAQRLARYVQRGGGLLLAPGMRVKPTFYNAWTTQSAESVAPARLADRCNADADPARLEPKTFSHPALQLVAASPQSDTATALVKSYWKLAADERDSAVRVGGRFHTGEPFLVERELGEGYVLMTAAPLDASVSNLPALKSFVPLVHEMVYYLAAPMMLDPNVAPGAQATLEFREAAARGDAVGSGLRGEYYDSPELTRLQATRVDPTIDFDWQEGRPHPSVREDSFSVRWTGYVRPRYSERYTFHGLTDDGVRLWVDGKQIINRWVNQSETEHTGSAALTAGRRHKLKLEYFEDSGQAVARLFWSSRSQDKEIVPQSQLFPAVADFAEAGEGDGQTTAEVITPSQRRRPARLTVAGGVLRVSFSETQEPGLYTLVLPPDLAKVYAPEGAEEGLPFVALGQVEESFIDTLSEADLDLAGQHIDLMSTERTDEMASAVAGGMPGEELWKYLAFGALFVLIAEIAITRWVAVQRRLHTVETVSFGEEEVDIQTFQQRAVQLLSVPSDSEESVNPS
ncbi:MAG: PA14 domain-containing protein [bacterium]